MIKIKHNGDASIVVLSLFVIVLIFLCAGFVIFHAVMVNRAEEIQDDVVLSNLAVYKNVDINALAIDEKNLRISDAAAAFETFIQHLKINMKLNDDFTVSKGSLVIDKVSIDDFTIYNVNKNHVEILSRSGNGNSFTRSEVMDKSVKPVTTSNGVIVRNTSVHATISYNVKLLFGQIKLVTTSVDTDIVK